ncbi:MULTISPECIES: hypothetical protein [Actinoalloteichus]|uniref:Uncharacterized protein n=1 Tax=Actinoalloteichus fjordicus TaxID=1612552 RepID=A0AAC9LA52_9PSEU|nr:MULTISPECIES: hypothetical protein [Actinoalloteichus]APU13155.1 hypothetical protein UA74_05395 [Actinoalloteichus fjordicus]APU19105.1 hypothetical protein UA75_05395 [Actinoalloteichus sp. GBA129-24]
MTVLLARGIAFVVAVATLTAVMRPDRWGIHHLFFVPDLVLIGLLAGSALLPARFARRGLTIAYAFAAGVVTTASFSYVARDAAAEGVPTMVIAAVCMILAVVLGARTPQGEARAEVTR